MKKLLGIVVLGLLWSNVGLSDENLKKTIEKMKNHEKEHLDFFTDELAEQMYKHKSSN